MAHGVDMSAPYGFLVAIIHRPTVRPIGHTFVYPMGLSHSIYLKMSSSTQWALAVNVLRKKLNCYHLNFIIHCALNYIE